jgi:hypothetical protein
MKTKTFIMVCLLLGIGMTQLSSQNIKSTETRTYQGWFTAGYWSPVFCGDEFKELLQGGVVSCHYVMHYKDGNFKWEVDQIKGYVTSESGEVFQIKVEVDKWYLMGDDLWVTWHTNLLGNRGSHYIGDVTVNWTQWLFYPGNSRCI